MAADWIWMDEDRAITLVSAFVILKQERSSFDSAADLLQFFKPERLNQLFISRETVGAVVAPAVQFVLAILTASKMFQPQVFLMASCSLPLPALWSCSVFPSYFHLVWFFFFYFKKICLFQVAYSTDSSPGPLLQIPISLKQIGKEPKQLLHEHEICSPCLHIFTLLLHSVSYTYINPTVQNGAGFLRISVASSELNEY